VHFIARPKYKLEKIFPKRWVGWILVFDKKKGYAEALEKLKHGAIIGIYPEGSTKVKNRRNTLGYRIEQANTSSRLELFMEASCCNCQYRKTFLCRQKGWCKYSNQMPDGKDIQAERIYPLI